MLELHLVRSAPLSTMFAARFVGGVFAWGVTVQSGNADVEILVQES